MATAKLVHDVATTGARVALLVAASGPFPRW